jgi:hypothetical protein
MSSDPAGAVPAKPPDGIAATVVCVLLACFAGAKRAAKIRRQLDKRITDGGTILDQVIVKIDAQHQVQVHNLRRTLAGTLTCALTWGIFGLLVGGLRSLGVWAIIGAVCGGLGAYDHERPVRPVGRPRGVRPAHEGVRPLLPPGNSTVLAWAEGDLTQQAIDGWSAAGSQQLILRSALPATASC